jgi:hypothetical protein
MVIKDEVLRQNIKKRGIWNFKDFYNFCFDWFQDERYILEEQEYTEKNHDNGKEIILKWDAWRKVTDYFKFHIVVQWHILGMVSKEVERDGKKEKTNDGEVKLKITAELERDWENRWERKPLWKFLRGIYDNYITRVTRDKYEDQLIEKTLEFIQESKAFLELN